MYYCTNILSQLYEYLNIEIRNEEQTEIEILIFLLCFSKDLLVHPIGYTLELTGLEGRITRK